MGDPVTAKPVPEIEISSDEGETWLKLNEGLTFRSATIHISIFAVENAFPTTIILLSFPVILIYIRKVHLNLNVMK